MIPTDEALIEEALETNHAEVRSERTLDTYRAHLAHYSQYLESAKAATIATAQRKHVLGFLAHLQVRGGTSPHPFREGCSWCADRGYPDGREGCGWSPSRVKSYLAAIRFVYRHMIEEECLPSIDPSRHIASPKVTVRRQYTPSREEVRKLLDAPGSPRDRLLAYWAYYAPSRRETFREARWRDFEGLDTTDAFWNVPNAKGGKADGFLLHPALRAELRRYRHWQEQEAKRNPRLRAALADEETAFVLLSSSGKQLHRSTLTKMIKWRAVRAGVAVVPSTDPDAVDGKSSKMTLHALRRAWADHALNDPENPLPIDVVAEVLSHADVRTTRLHYARTKKRRAHDALRGHRL
ncbi:MAG TPA: tyrosine-type recombinase/integrase [Capillimicrobium sp.]|nr:tyrosine-type recombinase/integrase [Capillimicrobium sp.]